MYAVIDQQWLPTPDEAAAVKRAIVRAAARNGLVVGLVRSGRGWLVTVEEQMQTQETP